MFARPGMAWDPCVSCGKEFRGPTVFTYATWYFGEERFAYRLRECMDCAAAARNAIIAKADYRDGEGGWQHLDGTPVASPTLAARKNGHGK